MYTAGKVVIPVLSILSTPIAHNRIGDAVIYELRGAENTAVQQPNHTYQSVFLSPEHNLISNQPTDIGICKA